MVSSASPESFSTSDEQLKAKFNDQGEPIIGRDKAEQAWSAAMRFAESANAGELLAAAAAS
ncbi:hypothetical protein [Noviherbaspirillum suwonense]|uniref:Uncharacterized protein n=1 Tax=Noviherbaspirillum suwonense TaxID=1224511 RepID=A0ABY1Q8P9_9BURK|nr:hypothetical protein [Noviherbaspirillum suwonense]SMP62154.1 hypothetical protein SAMN06295970_10847 [Noviherbaspirillum suwonense]